MIRSIRQFFCIQPLETTGAAIRTFVPLHLASRGLGLIRLLAFYELLRSDWGKGELGLYNWGQSLVSWLVPLMLLGAADVAERYTSHYQLQGQWTAFLRHQRRRLWTFGLIPCLAVIIIAPWLRGLIFKQAAMQPRWAGISDGVLVIDLAAINMLVLGQYQWLASVLRGCRAYGAAAGMELWAAALFLLLGSAAAWRGGALALLLVYLFSNLLPLLWYALELKHFVALPASASAAQTRSSFVRRDAFGWWTFGRLVLLQSFAFFALSMVGLLATDRGRTTQEIGDYSAAYLLAQFLAYVAITLWTATYGVCARHWSHGCRKRAKVQMLQVGKWGGMLVLGLAALTVLLRPLVARAIPGTYADAILHLLPVLLTLFLWYGLAIFFSSLGDLEERPWIGVIMWGAALVVQAIAIALGPRMVVSGPWHDLLMDTRYRVAYSSVLALGVALLVVTPLAFGVGIRPMRGAWPIVVVVIAGTLFLGPGAWLNVWAALAVPLALGGLAITGMLWQPIDRRAWRRWESTIWRRVGPKEKALQGSK